MYRLRQGFEEGECPGVRKVFKPPLYKTCSGGCLLEHPVPWWPDTQQPLQSPPLEARATLAQASACLGVLVPPEPGGFQTAGLRATEIQEPRKVATGCLPQHSRTLQLPKPAPPGLAEFPAAQPGTQQGWLLNRQGLTLPQTWEHVFTSHWVVGFTLIYISSRKTCNYTSVLAVHVVCVYEVSSQQ